LPPAANGTMTTTDLVGHASCASVAVPIDANAARATAKARNFISNLLPSCVPAANVCNASRNRRYCGRQRSYLDWRFLTIGGLGLEEFGWNSVPLACPLVAHRDGRRFAGQPPLSGNCDVDRFSSRNDL